MYDLRVALAWIVLALVPACSGQPIGADPDGTNGGDTGPPPAHDAEPLPDTIAYVRGDGDQIRLIDPDGTADRALWAHGLTDDHGTYEVWNMAWNEAATELAFVSTHENWCSIFASDVFALGADGEGYRRVTQAPACADLADHPSGTVRVPVRNDSFEAFSGFIYLQGAASVQPVNLPAMGSGQVVFDDVADLLGSGDDGVQFGAVIQGDQRMVAPSTAVDVVAGQTVTTAETSVYPPGTYWEVRSPTYHRDGSRIGHLLSFGSLWQVPATPPPLEFGASLLGESGTPDGFVAHMAWGPTAATSDLLLYAKSFDGAGVYLVEEGSGTPGEALVTFGDIEAVLGLAWLPDGSGFVYAVTEGPYFGDERSANLYLHDLASHVDEPLTTFVGDFAGQVSVSGDGNRFVFERATDLDEVGGSLIEPDLWIVERDASGLRLLVEDAYAPAWSR